MSSNRSLALNLAALALGMLMLAYASVPLYRLFCDVTGFGGTTRDAAKAPAPARISDRMVTVTFNADTDPGLPWEFRPGENSLRVRVGEQRLTHYVARNRADRPIKGHATYNVTPHKAGPYFVKIECFCFKEQTLEAKQRADMPVSFYLDPAMLDDPEMKDVQTITLSYTFFPVRN